MSDLLRVYLNPDEINALTGYPWNWHEEDREESTWESLGGNAMRETAGRLLRPAIKDCVRERDGHRCLRCHHPYEKGAGQWSRCDEQCDHGGPVQTYEGHTSGMPQQRFAEYRILTVHHLNGVKHDCRWWNLVSLCQRCHLSIQTRVVMTRPYWGEHSEWFKPFAAAFYANIYLGLEPTWEQVQERMDEWLALEHRQETFG